jgi:hypothetical protein
MEKRRLSIYRVDHFVLDPEAVAGRVSGGVIVGEGD